MTKISWMFNLKRLLYALRLRYSSGRWVSLAREDRAECQILCNTDVAQFIAGRMLEPEVREEIVNHCLVPVDERGYTVRGAGRFTCHVLGPMAYRDGDAWPEKTMAEKVQRPKDIDGNPVLPDAWYWGMDRVGQIVGTGKFANSGDDWTFFINGTEYEVRDWLYARAENPDRAFASLPSRKGVRE